MKTKTRFQKLTAWLLTLAMLMTFIPTFSQIGTGLTVYATEGTGSDSDDSELGGGTGDGGSEAGSGGSFGTEGDGTAVSYLAPVYEDGKIKFDENNDVVFETKTVTDYIVAEDIAYGDTITSADQMPTIGTSDETTWYVADSDVKWENFVLVQGDVHLIICDDVTINSSYGIVVSDGNSFTVYGQENGTGELIAKGMKYSGDFYSAAIGGCDVTTEMANGGTITINGCQITATASSNAAAIGGGNGGHGGNIIINGGTVSATATAYSAAIGGGSRGNSGNITINGGIVSAETSGSSSAIGAGYVMYSSTGGSILAKTDKIEINGGTVVASQTDSYEEYPVIGGLYGFDNINISGGHITVNHARSGGIGIGTNSVTVMEFDGNLNISGGTIISGNDKTLYLGAGKTSSSAKETVAVVVTGGNISGTFKNVSTLTDGTNNVVKKEFALVGAENKTPVTEIEGYEEYGLTDVVTDYDKLTIYVAENGAPEAIKTDEKTYLEAADGVYGVEGEKILSFNANGGTGAMSSISFLGSENKTLSLNEFTRSYYNFTGWNTSPDGNGTSYADGASINITENTVLYAQWEQITYNVTFDSGDGTGTMENDTAYAAASNNYILPECTFTAPEGKLFRGWKVGTSSTILIPGTKITVSSDTTATAVWSDPIVEVTVDGVTTTYPSLEQVIPVVKDKNAEIKVIEDFPLTAITSIYANKLVLDLNNHTLDGSSYIFYLYCDVEVKGPGTIQFTRRPFYVCNNFKMTIGESVNIMRTSGTSATSYAVQASNGSTLILNGGRVTCNSTTAPAIYSTGTAVVVNADGVASTFNAPNVYYNVTPTTVPTNNNTSGKIWYRIDNQITNGNVIIADGITTVYDEKIYGLAGQTVTITPKAGYTLADVKVNGNDATESSGNYTFSMPAGVATLIGTASSSHTHNWNYELVGTDTIKATCQTANCPETGAKTIVISASSKVYDGTAVTATVVNNFDSTDYSASIVYEAKTGSLTDGKAVNVGTYTAKITVGGVTASVDFEITPVTYNVTVTTATNGTVTADKTTVAENDTVTLTVTPATGYELESLTVDGTDVTAQVTNGTYTFTMPKGDVTVCATFKVSAFSANISAIDSASGNALAGATMQIIDSRGYVAEEWVSTTEAHTVEGLKTGEAYILRATVAPDGYTIPDDIDFYINTQGNIETDAVVAEGALLVKFEQTMVKVSAVESGAGEAIEGAHLQILDEEGDVVVVEGNKVEWVSAADDENTTSVDESVHEITGLKIGEVYTLRATVAPEGYTIPTVTTFVIKENGNITTTGNLTEDGIILSVFDLTVVQFSAVDGANGTALAGATMQVLDKNGDVVEEWVSEPDVEETVDVDESIQTITGLQIGTYTLRAMVVPEGYTIPADTTFSIDQNGIITTSGKLTGDGVLQIQFAENPKYTITYVLDGGTINGEYATSYTFGEGVSLPQNVTREGYTFDGWYDAAEGGTGPLMAFDRDKSGDLTVYAHWTPKTYTVTFVDGDGKTIGEPQTVEHGKAATAPADPTREGYTFDGWDQAFDNVTSDLTITAKWKVNAYSIIYMLDDTEYAKFTRNYGENVFAVISNPTKTGYTFSGWSQSMPATMPAHDVIITGSFTINQYTITFDTDGGSAVESITQDYGTAVTAPAAPTKTGYTFDGWDAIVPATMPAENVTVKATWNINQYTITFNTDGGNEIASITQDYGTAVTAPVDPTKSGYTFAGWNKDIPTIIPAENVTITAQWTLGIPVVSNVSGYSGEYDGVSHEISVIVDVVPNIDYSYQWYKDGKEEGNKINGATSAEYTVKDVADSGTYYCKVTASDGIQAQTVWSDNVDVTIAKKSIEAATVALDGTLTYTGAEQTQNITVTLDGFTVTYDVTDNKATNVKADGNYTLKVTANGNFEGEKTLEWNIAKADHIIEGENIPIASRIRRGNKLSDSTITPAELKDADENVLGTFTWVTPDDEMTETGDFVKQVKFTPTDTTNYNEKTFDVTVNVYRPSSGGGGSSSNTTTTTTKNEDGSTTKVTENKTTGTKTEVTTNTDGSTTTVETKKDGTVTTTEKDKDGNTTTTVEKSDGTSTTTEKNKDGSEKVTEEKADGTTVTTEKDTDGTKTVTTEKADGSTTTEEVRKDGTEVKTETTTDGETTSEVKADGKSEVTIPVPDTEKVQMVVVTDENGNNTYITEIETNDNGVAVTTDGNATVSVMSGNKKEFVDVHHVDHWSEKSVDFVHILGLMNGTSENHFSPDVDLTRAMLVTVLYRAEGEPEITNDKSFVDVENGSYYEKAVAWAKANGIVNGTSATTFEPNVSITREQIAAIMHRYADFKGHDVSVGENTNILSYDDVHHVSEYAIGAMQYAVGSGLIKGKTESTLNPLDNATRAEAAAILERFIKAN